MDWRDLFGLSVLGAVVISTVVVLAMYGRAVVLGRTSLHERLVGPDARVLLLLIALPLFAVGFTRYVGYVRTVDEHPAKSHLVFCSRLLHYAVRPQRGSMVFVQADTSDASRAPAHLRYMEPRVLSRDARSLDRAAFWLREHAAYGDAIRRVIALPGETVRITGSKVAVNGVPLAESYAAAIVGRPLRQETITLGPEQYLVARDLRHRSGSDDFYVVDGEQIVSRVLFVFLPWERCGFITNPAYNVSDSPVLQLRIAPETRRRLLEM